MGNITLVNRCDERGQYVELKVARGQQGTIVCTAAAVAPALRAVSEWGTLPHFRLEYRETVQSRWETADEPNLYANELAAEGAIRALQTRHPEHLFRFVRVTPTVIL